MFVMCIVKILGDYMRCGSRDRKKGENREFCLEVVYFSPIVSSNLEFYSYFEKKGTIAVDRT